ncbi:MAG: glycosyl transferase family 51 [Streptosporangiales bacterium]|nr:glycosyl transferase family 51 [Streptosporangiales bacterium]
MVQGSKRGDIARRVMVRKGARLAAVGAIAGVLVAGLAFPAVGGAGITARNAANGFQRLPDELDTPPLPERSRILAADGSLLATFYYENRISVPVDKIAPIMRNAIIAIEDSRFHQHTGVDSKGVIRALVVNARAGEVRQGGSTLTQQYVENVLVENADTKEEKLDIRSATVGSKLREMRYAVRLEKKYSKEQILERYLNITYFGDGAYGVEAAARHFFGKHASELEVREAALLAGLVRSPQAYNPAIYPEAARERRNVVLGRMAQLGMISRKQADQAMQAGLGLDLQSTRNGCMGTKAPFFCDYVLNEIKTDPVFGKTRDDRLALLLRGGLTIKTTLSPKVQRAAQRALTNYVPAKADKASSVATVEPGTGKIKAMAVSKQYENDAKKGATTVNLAADYAHGGNLGAQPGSTFKPFTLLTALDEGMSYGSAYIPSPSHVTLSGFEDCDGRPLGSWSVGNAGDSEAGTFNLMTGTWNSVNTFFAQLEKRVGVCDAVKMARKFGMAQADGSPIPVYPSFTLGSPEVDAVHLAAAYAGFGARGKYCQPTAITSIRSSHGRDVEVPEADCKQVVRPQVADALTHVLEGVLTKGTAAGQGIGRPAAGKTGTTDDYSAAWFAGYTPDLATAVWVGDPRGGRQHPLTGVSIGGRYYGTIYGATLPAPIWRMTMSAAHAGMPVSQFNSPQPRFFAGLRREEPKSEDEDSDRRGGRRDSPGPSPDNRGEGNEGPPGGPGPDEGFPSPTDNEPE